MEVPVKPFLWLIPAIRKTSQYCRERNYGLIGPSSAVAHVEVELVDLRAWLENGTLVAWDT
jgi:hypothetical protein